MTLPTKHSRLLTIDGDAFRWMVSARYEPEFGFVVEHAESPARLLRVTLGFGATVTPKLVVSYVRQALSSGWDPKQSGPPFRIFSAEDLPPDPPRKESWD